MNDLGMTIVSVVRCYARQHGCRWRHGSQSHSVLGKYSPGNDTQRLCNAIRGGVLQSIRFMPDKHIAVSIEPQRLLVVILLTHAKFVTFVDPSAVFTFYQVASYQGLTLNNRRLKIGWGKNSGPLPPVLALAVHSGATCNVYVGNIEDFDTFNDEKLKHDFGEHSDIELIKFLKEKCLFSFPELTATVKLMAYV